METVDLLVRKEGALGRLTLNRPRALNALTLPMCERVLDRLAAWAADPDIKSVLIDAVPGRAFCAGGDIRAVSEWARTGDRRAMEFFTTEYRMNAFIAGFAKPYIALIDGICMGGGAGISVHGRFCIASENTLFAMPETGIGFFPDVGGSFFLPRCPGETGMYLGLTGARIRAADMLYCGLATHYVPASRQADIVHRLASGEEMITILDSRATDAGPAPLAIHRAAIDRVFSAASVEEIATRLMEEGEWGSATLVVLRSRSPTSLKLTYRLLREGARRDVEACLALERKLVAKIFEGTEFHEGVRAALIDKDQAPRWNPPRLEGVEDRIIDRFFA